MYAIRVDAAEDMLRAEASGRVGTDQALRAISQAFALADAGVLARVLCDAREVERGPHLGTISAALRTRCRGGLRIALLVRSEQRPFAERLIHLAGAPRGLRAFESMAGASAWLAPQTAGYASPERRHLEGLAEPRDSEPAAAHTPSRRAEPAA